MYACKREIYRKGEKCKFSNLVHVIGEDIYAGSWSIADIVHQFTSHIQHQRCSKAITNGSDEPQGHPKHIYTVCMHENGSYRPLTLFPHLSDHVFPFSSHFQIKIRKRKRNQTKAKILAPLLLWPSLACFQMVCL